jgi:tRNA-splicing ligase RtcB
MKTFKRYGEAEEKTIKQMEVCMLDDWAVAGVLCADNHLGYGHPIGGVVAYENRISISGVGFDIGCGNLAIKTDAKSNQIRSSIDIIMDDIAKQIEFGVGSQGNRWKDHEIFENRLWESSVLADYKEEARKQLGSVGGGNHYIDVFESEDGFIWVGVHFGSRGLGHRTATHFMKVLEAKDSMDTPPCVVDADSYIGQSYILNMKLAGSYAEAGRECVARYVVKNILGASIVEEIHNHHNFAWKEKHNDKDLWVARKGSTPNFPNQKSFVGGSMGDSSFILRGLDNDENKNALYSTIHGAGRNISRKAAKEKFTRQEQSEWCKRIGVCVRGGDVDESPMAYKRINDVLEFHKGTVEIIHTLKPIGVAMAGASVKDPFKD